MPVKRDYQRKRLVLFRVGNHLPNHLLVAKVNAIEDANRNTNLATTGIQVGGLADDAHDSGSQLQERNHALLQLGDRKLQQVLVLNRVLHIEFARHNTPQRRQVRAATKFLAEIMR